MREVFFHLALFWNKILNWSFIRENNYAEWYTAEVFDNNLLKLKFSTIVLLNNYKKMIQLCNKSLLSQKLWFMNRYMSSNIPYFENCVVIQNIHDWNILIRKKNGSLFFTNESFHVNEKFFGQENIFIFFSGYKKCQQISIQPQNFIPIFRANPRWITLHLFTRPTFCFSQ